MQRNRHSEKPEINQRKAQRGTQKRESHLDGDDIGRSAGTGDDAAAASSGGSDGRSRGARERKVHSAKKERCERERKEDDGKESSSSDEPRTKKRRGKIQVLKSLADLALHLVGPLFLFSSLCAPSFY